MTVKIEFCEALLKRVGAHLIELNQDCQQPQSREEAFARFGEANDWAKQGIQSALAAEYPAIRWADFEFNATANRQAEFQDDYWVCDPIDGAVHYLQGLPFWSISLCLVRDGRAVLAFVYDPVKNELFHAAEGQGAFLNGSPIRVAQKTRLTDSVFGTLHPNFPAEDAAATRTASDTYARLMPRAFAVRMLGAVSLQLASVACGRLDGYFEGGFDLYDWFAGSLLIREAGGEVTSLHGEAFGFGADGILAANPALREEMRQAVAQ